MEAFIILWILLWIAGLLFWITMKLARGLCHWQPPAAKPKQEPEATPAQEPTKLELAMQAMADYKQDLLFAELVTNDPKLRVRLVAKAARKYCDRMEALQEKVEPKKPQRPARPTWVKPKP